MKIIKICIILICVLIAFLVFLLFKFNDICWGYWILMFLFLLIIVLGVGWLSFHICQFSYCSHKELLDINKLQNEQMHREALLKQLMDFKKEVSVKQSAGEKESPILNKGQGAQNHGTQANDNKCKNKILSFIRRVLRKLKKMFLL